MGPENLREYSTKELTPPRVMSPAMNISEPNTLTMTSDRLLIRLTVGPLTQAAPSAFWVAFEAASLRSRKRWQNSSSWW